MAGFRVITELGFQPDLKVGRQVMTQVGCKSATPWEMQIILKNDLDRVVEHEFKSCVSECIHMLCTLGALRYTRPVIPYHPTGCPKYKDAHLSDAGNIS